VLHFSKESGIKLRERKNKNEDGSNAAAVGLARGVFEVEG